MRGPRAPATARGCAKKTEFPSASLGVPAKPGRPIFWGEPIGASLLGQVIFADLIANTTNGANERAIGARVNFLAQVIDVDIDDVRNAIGVHAPDFFDDGIAGDGAAGMAEEIFQERIFLGTQLNGLSIAADFVRDAIHLEILEAESVRNGTIA